MKDSFQYGRAGYTDKAQGLVYYKVKQEEEDDRFSGSYWLRSSYSEWDEQQIWDTYMMLNRIEAAFRSLKHDLAFRPIYHRTEKRAEAHIFIAVLAYHLLNSICLQLRQDGINDSWNTVRARMTTHRRVSISALRRDKTTVIERITSSAEPYHLKIYKALNMGPSPVIKPLKQQICSPHRTQDAAQRMFSHSLLRGKDKVLPVSR